MSDNLQYAPFEKVKVLGEGSYGKAYLVRQLSDNSLAVLKQIDMAKMSSSEMSDAFKEAEILKHLNHPYIIRIKDVLKTASKKLWIFMEYADGGDLDAKIKIQKQTRAMFSEDLILDWFTQMCLAVKHIHDRKIIHRDLKCQNIFMTKAGKIKLGDFGIAKVLSHTREISKTVIGTPYYISPEILNNHPYRFETDIWSLGVILYELMKLEPPFQAKSLQLLSLKIVKGKYDDPGFNFSKEIKGLLASLLQVDPKRRAKLADVLNHPLIKARVNRYLSSDVLKEEFSHTVLHNQRINISKDKLNDQFKHLKVVYNENVARKPDTAPNIPKPAAPISKPIEVKKAVAEPSSRAVVAVAAPQHRPPGLSSGHGQRGSAAHLPQHAPHSDPNKPRVPEFGVQGSKYNVVAAGPASKPSAGNALPNRGSGQAGAPKSAQAINRPSQPDTRLQEEKQAYLRHIEELKQERMREMEKFREAEEKRKAEERKREEEKRLKREREERAKRIKAVEEQEAKARMAQRDKEEEEIRKALEADEKRQKREMERLKMQEDIARRRKEQMDSKGSADQVLGQPGGEKAQKGKYSDPKTPILDKLNYKNVPQGQGNSNGRESDSSRLKAAALNQFDSPSQKVLRPPKAQHSHQNLVKKPASTKPIHKHPWVGVGEEFALKGKESMGMSNSIGKESPKKQGIKPKYGSEARLPTPSGQKRVETQPEGLKLPRIATPQRRSGANSRRGSDAEEQLGGESGRRSNRKSREVFFEASESTEAAVDPQRTSMAKTASFVDNPVYGTASFHEFEQNIMEIHKASDQIADRFKELGGRGEPFSEDWGKDKGRNRSSSQTSNRGMSGMATGVDMITVGLVDADQTAGRGTAGGRGRPDVLLVGVRPVGDSAEPAGEENRGAIFGAVHASAGIGSQDVTTVGGRGDGRPVGHAVRGPQGRVACVGGAPELGRIGEGRDLPDQVDSEGTGLGGVREEQHLPAELAAHK